MAALATSSRPGNRARGSECTGRHHHIAPYRVERRAPRSRGRVLNDCPYVSYRDCLARIIVRHLSNGSDVVDVITVSPHFEIALPPRARLALGLVPGQSVQVLVDGGRLDLIPLPPLSALRGMLAGIDTHIVRERDRV